MTAFRRILGLFRAWWIVIAGALILIVVVFLMWRKIIDSQFGQTVVLALTAWVILWYTVETMRLRREAESRAERDSEPRIYFDVEQAGSQPGTSQQFVSYFNFKNHSSNRALARVTVRLSTSVATIVSPRGAYDGKQTWEVIPFFTIRGWFELNELISTARKAANTPSNPSGKMLLNVQVDVYRLDRKHSFTVSREYNLQVSQSAPVTVDFFPEVATSLPELPRFEQLP